jgi:hypothetical protein
MLKSPPRRSGDGSSPILLENTSRFLRPLKVPQGPPRIARSFNCGTCGPKGNRPGGTAEESCFSIVPLRARPTNGHPKPTGSHVSHYGLVAANWRLPPSEKMAWQHLREGRENGPKFSRTPAGGAGRARWESPQPTKLESHASHSRNPNAPPLFLLLGGEGQDEGELTTNFVPNSLDLPTALIACRRRRHSHQS